MVRIGFKVPKEQTEFNLIVGQRGGGKTFNFMIIALDENDKLMLASPRMAYNTAIGLKKYWTIQHPTYKIKVYDLNTREVVNGCG